MTPTPLIAAPAVGLGIFAASISARINGQPSFVIPEADGLAYTIAFDVREGLIAAHYLVRNRDNLGGLGVRT
jgi:hypothetical protein